MCLRFFAEVFLSSRVTGACPVTTYLIMRFNVRTATTITTYDSRVCIGSSGGAAMLNRDDHAGRPTPARSHYGAFSVCVEGTPPAGDWILRRRRRATERRRAGKRRIELSLEREVFFFKSAPQAARRFLFLGRGRRGIDGTGSNLVSTRESAKERAE